MSPILPRVVGWCLTFAIVYSGGVTAQSDLIPLRGTESLAFDRPESWAMQYFTSVSLFSGLGTPRGRQPGSVELAFEGGTVPNLGVEKRRVGFVGSKVEDLNRTNLFGRIRATVGLPRNFSITVGVTPPIEVDGVTPKLLNLAIARPLFDTDGWRLGARLHGQLGSIEGDLTCPQDVAGSVDPQVNPQGCLEASNDESTQNYIGLEISATPKIWGERWEPHVAVSANYMDLEFQVRATYSVFDDQERLLADGVTYALTVGLSYQLREKIEVRSAIFYTPLDVVRDPLRGSQNDELINARVILAYSVK